MPALPRPVIRKIMKMVPANANVTEIQMVCHRGTRVDAPRHILGASHVKPARSPANFDALFQAFTEDFCWDNVWSRDGLSRQTRSMLNLAMLSAMGRWHEFEVHVRGSLNNGASLEGSAEVLLRAGVYAGIPVAAEGMRRAKIVVQAHAAS